MEVQLWADEHITVNTTANPDFVTDPMAGSLSTLANNLTGGVCLTNDIGSLPFLS